MVAIKFASQLLISTVEPPIKDPSRKGQPPNKGYSSGHLFHISISSFLTSEKRTTSQQKDRMAAPKVSLVRGSVVQYLYQCCQSQFQS